MANNQRAKILSPEKLATLRQPLPRSWLEVAGILKKKKIHPLRYQKKIRQEWEKRWKKLLKAFPSL